MSIPLKRTRSSSPLKQVNTRQRSNVKENGELEVSQVTLYLDSRGEPMFVFKVPEYMQAALDVDSELREREAEEAERRWKELVLQYHEHTKLTQAEPVIVLMLHYSGRNAEGKRISGQDAFFDKRPNATRAGLGYELAFRVGKKIHHADLDREGKQVPGYVHHDATRGDDGLLVIDYTPELHAQVDRIVAMINTAAQALHALEHSANPAAMIGQLARRLLQAPEPTETDLELAAETAARGTSNLREGSTVRVPGVGEL